MSVHSTIVVGGGLAGLSATHTLLQHGVGVLLLDKKQSLGGNSVKASSGINGAGTNTQLQLNIHDSVESFYNDTTASAKSLARPHLIEALTSNSASTIEWLTGRFGVDLSRVSRLGGHSVPRTHRDQGGAPGWAITSALIKQLTNESSGIKIIKGARVTRLLEEAGHVIGVEYEAEEGTVQTKGKVILATGGYAADFSENGYLARYRPDLLSVATTNGDHATGDGHRLAASLSHPASLCDLDQVQVHPTGFIDPRNPDAKTKFLAAEALRGAGGLLIDGSGNRFVNEIDRRDAVTAKMEEIIHAGRGPVRLILNEEAVAEIKSHCDFYQSKGLMKRFDDLQGFAEDTGITLEVIRKTLDAHEKYASGIEADPFGKTIFHNPTYNMTGFVYMAMIAPVVHYTMGGIEVDSQSHVLDEKGNTIPGLYAAGEVIGGVHGKNRLAGSSLLEAVVFGRIAGETAAKEI